MGENKMPTQMTLYFASIVNRYNADSDLLAVRKDYSFLPIRTNPTEQEKMEVFYHNLIMEQWSLDHDTKWRDFLLGLLNDGKIAFTENKIRAV
jgi:hypothetical protein